MLQVPRPDACMGDAASECNMDQQHTLVLNSDPHKVSQKTKERTYTNAEVWY